MHGGQLFYLHLSGCAVDLDFGDLRGKRGDRRARWLIDTQMCDRVAILFDGKTHQLGEWDCFLPRRGIAAVERFQIARIAPQARSGKGEDLLFDF